MTLRRVLWVGLASGALACSSSSGGAGSSGDGGGAGSSGGSTSGGGTGSSSSSGGTGSSGSSSGGSVSCTQVAPCGGNLVGTWHITSACASSIDMGASASCPGQTSALQSITASGTATFNADMTYTTDLQVSFAETLTIPTSCLSGGGSAVSCSALMSSDDAGPSISNCTMQGADCQCSVTSTSPPNSTSGTYTTSGTTFTSTTTSDGGSGSPSTPDGYCVMGSTLYVISMPSADSGSSGSFELIGTKQ